MWCLAQTAESKPRLIGLAKILRLLGALSASSAWRKKDHTDMRGSGVGGRGGHWPVGHRRIETRRVSPKGGLNKGALQDCGSSP